MITQTNKKADEDMRSRGCGAKLAGDNALAAIRRVLWEGAA